MVTVNRNYLKLPGSYLFSAIAAENVCFSKGKSGSQNPSPWNWRCDTASCPGNY